MISFSLGFFNLIPFPALDGGRLLFVAIEAIFKKKVNPNVEGTIHFVEKSNSFEVTIREFKNLVKQEYLEPSKALASGVSVEELIDSDTLVERKALAENFLKTAQVGDKFQFMRKGFYCMDKDSTEENFVFNSTISLKDTYKK